MASLEPKLLNYLSPWCFLLFVPERLSEGGGSFGRNTFHDISNMQHTEALGPIFRYVAQYIIYRNISDGKRRTNKDCWITFEKELFCCSFQNVFLNEDGVLAGKLSMPIQTLKIPKLRGQYFDMLLNMFHIETYPTDSVHRAKGCELPLTLSSSCGCKCRGLPCWEQLHGRSFGRKALHDISNMVNTDATRPTFRNCFLWSNTNEIVYVIWWHDI